MLVFFSSSRRYGLAAGIHIVNVDSRLRGNDDIINISLYHNTIRSTL